MKQLMIWRHEDKSDMAKFMAEVFERISNETDRLSSRDVTAITFWNARGLPEPQVLLSLKEGTIIHISETWRTTGKTNLPSSLDSYNKVWSPAIKNKILGRPSGGLVTLIDKDLNYRILSSSHHWLATLVTINDVKIIMVSLYLSPSSSISTVLNDFKLTLDDLLLSTDFDLFIIGGDFNARLGLLNTVPLEAADGSHITLKRNSMDTKVTQRGIALNNFMEEHRFVLLNGRCHPDTSGKFTFFGAQGLSVVDLVWVNTASIDLITEFSVDQSAYRSDHYPIVVKVATKAHKPHM
ncbi:GSCOCG00011172001-RA-CDS [Cotesia congregata]|uniref:Endonuclease/exonuclease/phosphatase domain-containing protein n=1 Tax=Cotesia congregata TaxID=51543 RepID=A0A8J2MPS5_COTCN|nr:GSCOCG00011172001-RA-CDS [Cotesia congregata]CAG5100610.1 Protein of unknown function [Cotesia congregata]